MQEREISFHCKARYYTLGALTGKTRQIWFALHGYGQLAQYFMRNFEVLKQHEIFVIAPEGLSRFYLEDVQSRAQSGNNRVGATWMTRENRLADISNYLTLLNTIHAAEVGSTSLPTTILGFSQGAATASRWALEGQAKFDRLVLWAGILPPDMDFQSGKEILSNKDVVVVYGKKDPFLNDERFAEMKTLSDKLSIRPSIVEFDGGHVIDQQALLKLL